MNTTQEKKVSNAKRIGGIILNIVLWIFVAFTVVITIFVFSAQKDADGVPSLFGKSFISIVSDSMAPEIRTGDMIVVNKVSGTIEATKCHVGDVITFYSSLDINGNGKVGDDIETHKITKVREGDGLVYYTTIGTNEEYSHGIEDPEINSSKVIGVYTGIKFAGLGSVITFLGSPTGFLVCIVIPLVLFFLYQLIRFVIAFVKMRGQKTATATISEEDEEEIKRKAVEEYLAKQAAAAEVSRKEENPDDVSQEPEESEEPVSEE